MIWQCTTKGSVPIEPVSIIEPVPPIQPVRPCWDDLSVVKVWKLGLELGQVRSSVFRRKSAILPVKTAKSIERCVAP